LFAAVNAALQVRALGGGNPEASAAGSMTYAQDSWMPARDQAYLGVMADDLITKDVTEPYRMFTSRAEFRLQLREDNADARLTEVGRQLGLVDDVRWDAFCRKRDAVSRETERLRSIWVNPKNLETSEAERVFGKALEHEYNLAELLRRPGVSYAGLMSLSDRKYVAPELSMDVSRETEVSPDDAALAATVVEQVEIAAKYSGYIDRQKDDVQRAVHYETLKLPQDLDYMQVTALSIEARQKLNRFKPETLGQASRLSGITPATISLLTIHLKKTKFKGFAVQETNLGDTGVDAAPEIKSVVVE
jgi:tRNA uridine 5-carboxymethylaminomethyl modification enzyme